MAWLDSTYRRRALCTVVTTSASATVNAQLTVPPGLDALWDVIDANGYGVRITTADGETELTYDVSTFTLATRAMVIDIEGIPTTSTASRAVAFRLYYDPSTTATDGSGAPSTASQLTAYLELARPSTYVVEYRPQTRTTTQPPVGIQKTVDDQVYLWVDYTDALERPAGAYRDRQHYEEPWVGGYQVLFDGSTVAGMIDTAALRWVSYRDGRRERVALRLLLKSGVDLRTYTVESLATTISPAASTAHRELAFRVALDTTDAEAEGAEPTARLGARGWATYADSTHTIGSPQAITASTRAQWTNDAGTVTETYLATGDSSYWDTDKIESPIVGAAFSLRIDFTIDPASTSGVLTIDLDIGSDPFGASSVVILERSQVLAKGSGAQKVSMGFPIFSLATFVANGCAIGITCNQNANVYDKFITIVREY